MNFINFDWENALLQLGDSEPKYEILLNDRRISFTNKRVFASKAAAKTAVTRAVDNLFYKAKTNSEWLKIRVPGFDLKKFKKEYKNQQKTLNIKKEVKAIVDYLLENEIIKINQI